MTDIAQTPSTRGRMLVIGYPFALIAIGLAFNLLLFGVAPAEVALPAKPILGVLVFAAILLLANHSWLMTVTELTRSRFGLFATPEEWVAANKVRREASAKGLEEVERCHNAHRNTTENTVYFVVLAGLTALVSPAYGAALVWIGGYGLARLGYTYSYLFGHDGLRGLFMSLGLLSLYGLASYLVVSLLV